jgi:hypothetical protein
MRFDISLETQARLVARAQEQGLSIDAPLERLLNDDAMPVGAANGEVPELPAWHLGVRGSLRRRDIYNA